MVGILNFLLPALLEQEEEDTKWFIESDDDIILFAAVCCFVRRSLNRVNSFHEVTIPSYLESEFQGHFRMTRETCESLTREIIRTGAIPLDNPSGGRPIIAPEKQVLLSLWTMANKEPNRAIADRFNVTMSSAHRAFRRVMLAVLNLYPEYIKWPNAREAHEIAHAFQDEWGFPGVVGLIDGTHVHIGAPEHEPDAYINRKKFHSFNVQAIIYRFSQA
ncbi:putative nuclease HARBI1 [Montipora foliosa]|uniref:putative nuclease HARBI1 n=1 Tax=Montipora foliosa TaxID=591990 RepID=UPI0035F20C6A